MNAAVRSYIPLVDFLEAALGPQSEIVLHDFTDPDHSVVDIRNGHVSGRSIGAPATDLALKILNEGARDGRTFKADYISHSPTNRPLRSASFFIRDEDGELAGMLCINTDVALLTQLTELADQIAQAYLPGHLRESGGIGSSAVPAGPEQARPHLDAPTLEVESLSDSTQSLIGKSIRDLAAQRDRAPRELGQAERVDIIRALEGNGLFRLKGAVAAAAEALGISEPSVYRYLQKVRKE